MRAPNITAPRALEHPMEGLHLTADGSGCTAPPELFLNPERLRELMVTATQAAGLTVVGEKFHAFPHPDGSPAGVTGVLLLAESHVAIHTWPERMAVTLDVYVCNVSSDNSAKARALMQALTQAFQPGALSQQSLLRGVRSTQMVLESLSRDTVYGTRIAPPLARSVSQFQEIEIAQSADFGKLMRIDGALMTSEKDEFCYHECLIHPAVIAHAAADTGAHSVASRALIIGGGDGGAADELLKHRGIQHITLCEIDAEVVTLSRQHLQSIHRGALDDAKVHVLHEDGFAYVRHVAQQQSHAYDLIFLDLTDPLTPTGSSLAASCLTADFFAACRQALSTDGMLVLHLGSPFYHAQRFTDTLTKLSKSFAIVRPYTVFIPLYGALWGMAIASKSVDPVALAPQIIADRIAQAQLPDLQYYNAEVHAALFALPTYVRRLVPGA